MLMSVVNKNFRKRISEHMDVTSLMVDPFYEQIYIVYPESRRSQLQVFHSFPFFQYRTYMHFESHLLKRAIFGPYFFGPADHQ